jgi:hypothetical protein
MVMISDICDQCKWFCKGYSETEFCDFATKKREEETMPQLKPDIKSCITCKWDDRLNHTCTKPSCPYKEPEKGENPFWTCWEEKERQEPKDCINCRYSSYDSTSHPCRNCCENDLWEQEMTDKYCGNCKYEKESPREFPCSNCLPENKYWQKRKVTKEMTDKYCSNCSQYHTDLCNDCGNREYWKPVDIEQTVQPQGAREDWSDCEDEDMKCDDKNCACHKPEPPTFPTFWAVGYISHMNGEEQLECYGEMYINQAGAEETAEAMAVEDGVACYVFEVKSSFTSQGVVKAVAK